MSSHLTPFAFQDHLVRIIDRDGEPWFVLADVCRVLEIGNTGDALTRLDEDEKGFIDITDGTPGTPRRAIINESGLYSLVLTSRKEAAKRFKKWVTSEVIPSIRKTGSYEIQANGKKIASQAKIKAVKMRFIHAVSDLEDLGVDTTTIDMGAVQKFARRHLR